MSKHRQKSGGKRHGRRAARRREPGSRAPNATAPPGRTARPPGSTAGSAGRPPAEAGQAAERPGGRLAPVVPWFEARPRILLSELDALDAAGIRYQIREDARAAGILALDLAVDVGGRSIELCAIYPDLFPYVRPEVFAPGLDISKHRNPFAGNLCLLGRATEKWQVDDTLAWLLTEQLSHLLEATGVVPIGPDGPPPEEAQGEPLTTLYETETSASFLISGAWSIPSDVSAGTLELAVERRRNGPVRGTVMAVKDEDGTVLAEAPRELRRIYEDAVIVPGRWVRATGVISQDPDDPAASFQRELLVLRPELARSLRRELDNRRSTDIVGVLFEEEVRAGVLGDAWVFLVRTYVGANAQRPYLVRTERAGRDDLAERVPELDHLHDKCVVIFGVGGLGAPIALELARGGLGELRLVDHDRFDAATAVRWPFGLAVAGDLKVEILRQFIAAHLPYTHVAAYPHRLGAVRIRAQQPSDIAILSHALRGADLVIDATAERGLHHPIAEFARERGVPYVEVSTRNGAWGGLVGRLIPGPNRPCWLCLDLLVAEDGFAPVADPAPQRQPLGCADPTFTGASFDMAMVSSAAVRLAVGTLGRATSGAYPDPEWDVAVIDLREPDGRLTTPRFRTRGLTSPDPRCRNHH